MKLDVEYIQPKSILGRFIYSVKFVCADELVSGGGTVPRIRTTINIQNVSTSTVTFTKRGVVARPQGEPIGPVGAPVTETLARFEALQVNCANIDALIAPLPLGTLEREGFIVIDSPTGNLQVTAVYETLKS